MLALHGWGRSHSDFHQALVGLDALSLDLPGFGASPAPEEAWSTADYAAAIAPLLDELAHPAVIVGHSFGGRIAVHFGDDPRIGGYVLTGVPLLHRTGKPPKAPLRYRIVRLLHGWGWISDDRIERTRRRHGSADYRAAEGPMRDVLVMAVNESYEDQLDAISKPIELVWGTDDAEAPPSIASQVEVMLPNATLTLSSGIGHFLPLEAPAVLRAAIERRLAALES